MSDDDLSPFASQDAPACMTGPWFARQPLPPPKGLAISRVDAVDELSDEVCRSPAVSDASEAETKPTVIFGHEVCGHMSNAFPPPSLQVPAP